MREIVLKIIGEKNKNGQVLLLIVLMVSVLITMIFASSYQTRVDTRFSKLQQESTRAIAAGEAGVELGYTLPPAGTQTFSTFTPQLSALTGIDMDKSTLTVSNNESQSAFVSPLVLNQQQYTFYLSSYSNSTYGSTANLNKLFVYYGTADNGNAQCNNVALEMSYIGSPSTDTKVEAVERFYDPGNRVRTLIFQGTRVWRYDCDASLTNCEAVYTKTLSEWLADIGHQANWAFLPDANSSIDAISSYYIHNNNQIRFTFSQSNSLWTFICHRAGTDLNNCRAESAYSTVNAWLASVNRNNWDVFVPDNAPIEGLDFHLTPSGNKIRAQFNQGKLIWRYDCDLGMADIANCSAVSWTTSMPSVGNWLLPVAGLTNWNVQPSTNTGLDDMVMYDTADNLYARVLLFQGNNIWPFSCDKDFAGDDFNNCQAESKQSLGQWLEWINKSNWVSNQPKIANRLVADTGNIFSSQNDNIAEVGPAGGYTLTVDGVDTTFYCRSPLMNNPYSYLPVDAKLLMVRLFSTTGDYNSKLGFMTDAGASVLLPAQGKTIIADTWTTGQVHKIIRSFQSYPQIPMEFFVTGL